MIRTEMPAPSSSRRTFPPVATAVLVVAALLPPSRAAPPPTAVATATADGVPVSPQAAEWRAGHRLVDLHLHLGTEPRHLERAVAVLDAAGVGLGVNLSGGTVTPGADGVSAFQRVKEQADRLFPGRFVHYMNLDYSGWDDPDFAERAARQVEAGHRLGAAGLKEYKRLGLFLRDGSGQLIAIDDPKLDPVWAKCGELGMPVSIHVADPKAFWEPYEESNERWTELKDHPSWWFGNPDKYPPRLELLEALNRVIARHPETTFVAVHFANNAEDLDWVGRQLERFPNLHADLAARVPEIGRHDPAAVRRLFTRFADRILFATDFMVYDKFILGSGGSGPEPSHEDAVNFYEKHWRWFETDDRGFAHMTPIQGEWTIDAIDLPDEVLRKVYFDNARRLLVRSLPLPSVTAPRPRSSDPAGTAVIDGRLDEPAWAGAAIVPVESRIDTGESLPASGGEALLRWDGTALLVAFRSPVESITVFDEPIPGGASERHGLWERDVVEVFLAPGAEDPAVWFEYEVAPTGEKLDLRIEKPDHDLAWDGGFEAATIVDEAAGTWTTEIRIPLDRCLPEGRAPKAGDAWRLNLYRHDAGRRAFVGWHPTATRSAHAPARFGNLVLGE